MHHQRPSNTACKVALNILTLGEKPEMAEILPPGIVEATEKLLLASDAVGATTLGWYRTSWMVQVYKAFDWMMPGQFEAFAHRKAFCERQVGMALGAGATQVLMLGAGYDTLGWRLAPRFPDVHFFEIDHPGTSCPKAKGVEKMGGHPNLHLIAEDLDRRRLFDVLADNEHWHRSSQTIILAEGLLQYLSPYAVRDLFTQCAAIALKSRIAFTYIPTGRDGRPDAGPWTNLVLWILAHNGEPWLWSIRSEELDRFLNTSGWIYAPELTGATQKYGLEWYAVATRKGGIEED